MVYHNLAERVKIAYKIFSKIYSKKKWDCKNTVPNLVYSNENEKNYCCGA